MPSARNFLGYSNQSLFKSNIMAKTKAKKVFTAEEAIAEINHPGVPMPKGTNKLEVLWGKVEPILLMFGSILGTKVKNYIQAFADAIDELIAEQNNPDGAEEAA